MKLSNKEKTIYVCSNCGNESLQWQGKCSYCGEWNTLRELKIQKSKLKIKTENREPVEVTKLNQVKTDKFKRISTQIGEVDRVLGGGIVPGSVILLGGDPGIGKSTLLLQLANRLTGNLDVLYVSGEESAQQIKLRVDRLGMVNSKLQFLAETDVDEIITKLSNLSRRQHGSEHRPQTPEKSQICVIDSIQTMFDSAYPSTPGSIVQVRECALKFQQLAKRENISIILVGHMTKGGEVAGPRILEHLVDVVLYLEGERYHNTRILRGAKNRFGATDEIGLFEMGEGGLCELENPSKIFLSERLVGAPGSVVTAAIEGTRPLLVEIQALTAKTYFGYPKRAASGLDINRLQLLTAVIQKRTGLNLADQDIYINVVGGFKLKEPAVDLAVCLAIVSAYRNKKIDPRLCVFGEVGLSGEIRSVSRAELRSKEAQRLGLSKIIKARTIKEAIDQAVVGEL